MPTIRTPSVIQQRIIVIVSLVAIGVVAWWQNAGGGAEYPVQKFFKTPVPDRVSELDFTSAEVSWSSLRIDAQGNLIVDALTETALLDAVVLLREQPSALPMQRMALLLEKQFGPKASEQITELLPILKHYKDVEQRWWAANGSKNPPPHAALFRLQDELLGATLAEAMFSEQRRLMIMMLASQRIRDDSGLTQAQKDEALEGLQKSFERNGVH